MKYTRPDTKRPIFIPSVGNFKQGMLVHLPLHLDLTCPASPRRRSARRAGRALRKKQPNGSGAARPRTGGKLDPLALNDTNKLEMRVFSQRRDRQAVLIARLDNLGKGASGAAVQNL